MTLSKEVGLEILESWIRKGEGKQKATKWAITAAVVTGEATRQATAPFPTTNQTQLISSSSSPSPSTSQSLSPSSSPSLSPSSSSRSLPSSLLRFSQVMKEERHQHRFPQLITLLCKAIDIKQTKPEQANTVDINQSIKSPSDSCSQCQICCLSFSVLSLNVQPCWARAYSSICLCVMCVLCFMCICVVVYLHIFICLFVCACLSVSPHAIHQIPNVNVRLPTKNQLGFNEARTPCAPH